MNEKHNERIERANKVKEIINTAGFKELEKEWHKIKGYCLSVFESDKYNAEELKIAQITYKRILLWINIPNKIISDGEQAVIALEKELEESKKSVPFKNFLNRF
jgi:hypothetical protein